MISERPDFGPNRGNRGPISATFGPSRLKPRFGRRKRGTVKAIIAKNGAAADVLICPGFSQKSGFLNTIISERPDFGPDRGNRWPISATSGPSRLQPRFGRTKRGTVNAISAKKWRRCRRADLPRFISEIRIS